VTVSALYRRCAGCDGRAADSCAPGDPEEGCESFARLIRPARQSKPANRKTVLYGVVLYALARVPFDRHFQQEVITLAIGLAAAKNILQVGALESFKALSAWTERNYLREKRAELHTAEQRAAGEIRAEAAHRPRRQ
jgi:hypothetical protein